MAYATMRLFSGDTSRDVDELDRTAERELVPQLMKSPGLIRYSTVQMKDGRVGSFSVFQDNEAAARAQQIAKAWMGSAKAMSGYKLSEAMSGEVLYMFSGSSKQSKKLHAVVRLYRTNASQDELRTAFETDAPDVAKAVSGFVRLAVVKLEDGRVGVFSAYETEEAARQFTAGARAIRTKSGSALSRVLPNDPETLEGTVLTTYTLQ